MLPCPAGTFCKGYNLEPRPCPWLATCPAKSESADLSLGGFLGMSLILAILWLAYVALSAFIRCVTGVLSCIFKCILCAHACQDV